MERLAAERAFIIGYTGEVGKQLVKELLEQNVFSKLILVGRRKVDYSDNAVFSKAEQVEVNFDQLENYKDAFNGCEYGFSCLGTTKSVAGAEGFVKVDHDYVVNTAKIAAETGCKHFSVVSSAGSNKNSFFLYPKTKGLMEEDISKLPFQSVSIFKPGLLLCDRPNRRFTETAATILLKPVTLVAPTLMSVPTVSVAKAMIFQAAQRGKDVAQDKVQLIDNQAIHRMAAGYDDENLKSVQKE